MKPSLDEIAAHLGLCRHQIKALLSEGVLTTRMSLPEMKKAYAKHLVLVRRGERPAVLDRRESSLDRDLERLLRRL